MEAGEAARGLHEALRPAPFGECQRLAGLIAAYGKAIERDLAARYPGTDLATEWRARRWRKLLNFIDGLPRNSAYVEAVSEDEELAEVLADNKAESGPARPRISEYSPEVERFDILIDRVGELIRAVAASHGAKTSPIDPVPRPVTALQRARRRRREQRHRSVVRRLLPSQNVDQQP